MNKKSIIETLVKVKYLLLKGRAALDEYGPCSSGIAVSSLQDSVEMFLRLIVAARHININKEEKFHSIIDKINADISPDTLKYRTSLNRLNNARVDFKHLGNEVDKKYVVGFFRDMEVFITDTSSKYLHVDFSDVLLIDLIGHQRTMNWLKKAEEHLEKEEFVDSVTASACAFAIFRKYISGDQSLKKYVPPRNLPENRRLNDFFHKVASQLQDHSDKIDIIMSGVSLPDYSRFIKMTPSVSFMLAGNIHHSKMQMKVVPLQEEAQFCIRFVLDSALAMIEKNPFPGGYVFKGDQKVKVIENCAILIGPQDDQEVILEVTGKNHLIFDSIAKKSRKGYVHILFQGDHAYLPDKSVEIMPT